MSLSGWHVISHQKVLPSAECICSSVHCLPASNSVYSSIVHLYLLTTDICGLMVKAQTFSLCSWFDVNLQVGFLILSVQYPVKC